MARAAFCLLLLWVGASALGCKRLATGAAEEFSRQFSCPVSKVDVHARSDLKASEILFGNLPPAVPPADVANDPERLAVWTENERKAMKAADSTCEVFEVKGCNEEALYCCGRARTGRGVSTSDVGCVRGGSPMDG